MKRILFNTHPIVKKWAVPNLYGSGDLFQDISTKSKLLRKSYKTPLVCLNPGVAFWLRTKYEKSPNLKITRIPITMSDGGTVGLDMLELPDGTPTVSNPSLPNVILFPGGNETTQSTKPKTLIRSYLEAGYPRVFLCNYRGKGGTPLTSPRYTFPFGEYNDIPDLIEVLEEKYRHERWLLSGSCYGGSHIIDYMASPHSDRDNVIGAVLHSMQWNLARATKRSMRDPSFSLFTRPFAVFMKDKLLNAKPGEEDVHRKICEIIGQENMELIKNNPLKTKEDIENLYIHGLAPLCSIRTYTDYFNHLSPDKKVHRVTKPTIIINSADDITAPMNQDDIDGIVSNPNMCLWLFAAGGHCAYVKSLFPLTNYIDEVMVECADIVCGSKSK